MNLAIERVGSIIPAVLPILAFSLLFLNRVQESLVRFTNRCCYEWGAFRTTWLLSLLLQCLPLADWMHHRLYRMRIHASTALGWTRLSVAGAHELMEHAKHDGCLSCATCAVSAFINAGLYREALDIEWGWRGAMIPGNPLARQEWLLVKLHLVEAVYNLGDWGSAIERLDTLEALARPFPFIRNLFSVRRAWVLAHIGRGGYALAQLDTVDMKRVLRPDRSEVHFTRAAALLAVHRHQEAEREAQKGMDLTLRAASWRNGLFLLGSIAHAAGRTEEALCLFGAGAAQRYKGQGGDGLLAWGDYLDELGHQDEARDVWRLVLKRDGQSGAAREAALRLGLTARLTARRWSATG